MKKFIVISGIILLIANILFGLILTSYETFNVCINCGVIVLTSLFLFSLRKIQMKDAYAISLSVLFSFFGIISFILGCIAPKGFNDNWYLLAIIILLTCEEIILAVTNILSSKIK